MGKEYQEILKFKYQYMENSHKSKDAYKLYKSNLDFLKVVLIIILKRNINDGDVWINIQKLIRNNEVNQEITNLLNLIYENKSSFELIEFSKQSKFYDVLIELRYLINQFYFIGINQVGGITVNENPSNYGAEVTSKLKSEINKLRSESSYVVANENQFSELHNYLHIRRQVEDILIEKIRLAQMNNNSHLIFLCGNVGDGKSHLLSFLRNQHTDLVENFNMINDATESIKPSYTSIDTLKDKLKNFKDNSLKTANDKTILAINLGILSNFIHDTNVQKEFSLLVKYIQNTGIFNGYNEVESEYFSIINISDFGFIEVTNDNIVSNYITDFINRITINDEKNPFYKAYLEDCKSQSYNYEHFNYELLMYADVKAKITDLLVRSMIECNLLISMRILLNFVHTIIVGEVNSFKHERLLPNLLFNSHNDLPLFVALCENDPITYKSYFIDDLILRVNLNESISDILKTNTILSEKHINYIKDNLEGNPSKSILRFIYLLRNKTSNLVFDNQYFNLYKEYLVNYINSDSKKIQSLYSLVINTLIKWNGNIDKDIVYTNKTNSEIKILKRISINKSLQKSNSNKFVRSIKIGLKNNQDKLEVIEVDYALFSIMSKIDSGYIANKTDKNKFSNFDIKVSSIIENFSYINEEYIINQKSKQIFKIVYDEDFESYDISEVKYDY